MSYSNVNVAMHHVKRVSKAEFFVYFALIFTLALGPHSLGWTYQLIRHARLPRLSPVARARKDAQAVTPMIFRG